MSDCRTDGDVRAAGRRFAVPSHPEGVYVCRLDSRRIVVSIDPLQVVELLSAVVALGLGAFAWRNREEPGAIPLVVLTVGVAVWLVTGVLRGLRATIRTDPLVAAFFFGVSMAVAGWGAFALEFGGYRRRVGRRVWGLLAVEPVAVALAVLTNDRHGAFYRFDPQTGEMLGLGIAYEVHAAYAYVVVVTGLGLVASVLWRRQTLHPGQVYLVLLGALLPWLADVLVTVGIVDVSIQSPALVGSCLCLTVGLFRHKLMRLSPAAQGPLLENLRDGVFVLDRDDQFADVNPTAEAVLGDDGLEGRDAASYLADHPAFGPHAERMTTATAETTFEVEVDERYYDVRVTPLFDHRDEPVGRQIQLHDVTEQRRRERELERQNERLDRFASVLSHDLRNPLNVATGRTELVKQTGDVSHVEEAAEALDRIEAIIEETLVLAREGQAVESTETVVLASVAETAWANVETDEATLVVETDRAVEADPDRTVRAFENLFRNSIDHAGPDVTVTVGDRDDGFYVADDGPGIPPEDREQVLEYGYTTDADGTGLGLAIVASIADAHGWTMSVTESAEDGARFEVRGVETVAVSAPEATD